MRCFTSVAAALLAASAAHADFDAAAAFGARPSVWQVRLSPDGSSLAYLTVAGDRGTSVVTVSLARDAKRQVALTSSGTPERLGGCNWVANDRLVCRLFWIGPRPDLLPFSRLVAVNVDGGNLRVLNTPHTFYSRGFELGASDVIDWLPEEDGVVLMSRPAFANDRLGSRLGSDAHGLGVDRIDTRTLAARPVIAPVPNAVQFITDGHGEVRIRAESIHEGATQLGRRYLYRDKDSSTWTELSSFDYQSQSGFRPFAVDRDRNVAYGFDKLNGRQALYSKALAPGAAATVVYARDDVDVDTPVRVGRHGRVVGVSYATEYRHAQLTDEKLERLSEALQKALPGRTELTIVDASVDESRLLIYSSSDVDAGVYYLFDHNTHHLDTLMVERAALEGVTLANMRPVSIRARDGVSIPGYLTLPPGTKDAKGLPAIVMPHGGPSARDEWGFDWLAQFFAARGYVVLQPNFRGSAGYGDAWFQHNGFQSWPQAISDVLDAGKWLISEGIADPKRLAIFGWSYGGYAALQSLVTDPSVFRAAIAVAPVTDLPALTEQYRDWSNYFLMRDFIGTGPHTHAGSPAENAAKIKVPVLLFHGTEDINTRVNQSQLMDQALSAAGVKHELVTFDGLDHQLEDSAARTQVLRRSDTFLQQAFAP